MSKLSNTKDEFTYVYDTIENYWPRHTSSNCPLPIGNWNLFHGAESPSPYLIPRLSYEPAYYYADHLLLLFLTNISAIITYKFLTCKIDFREGFMGVYHNWAPERKEEKPSQYKVSKNNQIIMTIPVASLLWIYVKMLTIRSSSCEITLDFHRNYMEMKVLGNTQNLQD